MKVSERVDSHQILLDILDTRCLGFLERLLLCEESFCCLLGHDHQLLLIDSTLDPLACYFAIGIVASADAFHIEWLRNFVGHAMLR